MPTLERQIQNCLNKIEKWTNENGFQFSKTKTVCIHFCKSRTYHLNLEININRHTIPAVQQAKYLGMIFDNKLNFKAHIEYLLQKCLEDLKLLKIISKMNWGAGCKVMLRIYRSHIRTKVDYRSSIYNTTHKSYFKKLQTIHNQGLRLSLGALHTSPTQRLYIKANKPPLTLRWEKLSLQYALKF